MNPILALFDDDRSIRALLADLVDDVDAACAATREHLEEMAPASAYLDTPDSPLARALFFCTIHLAAYKAAAPQGVDAHAYGAAMLEQLSQQQPAPQPVPDDAELAASFAGPGTHPGEFQVELAERGDGDEDQFDYGYNIKSCAICYLFSRHDAMDLVPYMCASDDVMSDLRGEGLRRTGTIALGAHQCDFRYQAAGNPRRVAEHYPDKIKFVHSG